MKIKSTVPRLSWLVTIMIAALALNSLATAATFTATYTNGFGDGIWERDQHIGNLGNPADFSTAGNWSTGAYPSNGHAISDPNTSAVIPGSNPSYDASITLASPCTLGISVTVLSLNVSSISTLNIAPNGNLFLNGSSGVTNNGAIVVNTTDPVNSTSALEFDQTATLSGTGSVRLNGIGFNRANLKFGGGSTLTIGANQTVQGRGTILGDGLFVNNGTIIGDDAAGNSLQIDFIYNDSVLHQNNGLIKAIGGGVVGLYSGTMDQTGGGSFLADGAGSKLQIGGNNNGGIVGATLIGGTLNTTNGGVTEIVGGNGTLMKGVTNNGAVQIPGSRVLYVRGTGLTNNGTMLVNSTDPVADTGNLEFDESGALDGNGTVTLNGIGYNRANLKFGGGSTLTIGANQTVKGRGTILGDGLFVNNGTIIGDDAAGNSMQLDFIYNDGLLHKNNSVIKAIGGGVVGLYSGILDQSGGGSFTADGAGSKLQIGGNNNGGIVGATLIGGTLNTTNGGVIEIVGGNNALFKGVTNNGAIKIPASHTLYVRGTGLTDNGTILVNSTDPVNANGLLEFDEAGTLGGSGLLRLDGASSGRAALFINNVAVTHGSGHTIGGNGDLFIDGAGASLLNNGTIAPGSSAGNLNYRGDLQLGSTSKLAFEVGGTTQVTQYDLLNKTDGGVLTLNGNLSVTLINGFTPAPGDVFTIVTTQNILAGAFSNVANGARLNTTDGGGSFTVTYTVVNNALLSRNVTLSDFQVPVSTDTTPPVITVPANITVLKQKHRPCTTVTFSVSATDDVDGPVAATASPPSGSCFPKGVTTVTVTASDRAGNTATKQFLVTVNKKKHR